MNTIETIRIALQTSYDWNRMLAEDMRDAAMTFPTPRGGNHPTWIVGHAAHASAGLLSMITGEPNPLAHFDATLGGNSQPTANADDYPPYDEALSMWEREHRRRLEALDTFDPSRLDEAPAAVPESLRSFPDFQSIGRVFLLIALHEMSHRGQLADARRAAGRPVLAF